MRKVMMALWMVAAAGLAFGAMPLKLDFGTSTSGVEPGWTKWADNQGLTRTFDGVTVTLGGTLAWRNRSNSELNGVPNEQLWRDFFYASMSNITITIDGLEENMLYELSVGTFDIASSTATPHVADWKVNGVTILTTSFGIPGVPIATLVPSATRNYLISGLATSDATGRIVLQSAVGATNGGGNWAFVNGLVVNPVKWATNPSPANGATNVLLDAVLSWSTGMDPNNPTQPNPAIRAHYVYLCEDEPNFVDVTPVQILAGSPVASTGSYDPAVLDMDKTYYWRVDEAIDNGSGGFSAPGDPATIAGKVWSFETIKSFAVINTQPVNTKALEGGTAQFTVAYTSFSPAFVRWSKDGLPITFGGDITIADTETSSTLSIANADSIDEGAYSCTVTNDAGPVSSENALFVIKRLLAHYPFEQNADDAVGAADGTAVNNVAYSVGIVTSGAQAWAADPNGANYFEVPGAAAYPRAGFGKGLEEFTYSFWVKRGTYSGNGRIFGSFNRDGVDMVNFRNTAVQLNVTGTGSVECHFRAEGDRNGTLTTPADTINADEWHHILFTFKSNFMKCFIDGEYRYYVDYTGSAPLDTFADWQYPMAIMARNVRGVTGEFYPGEADDLRIYNYELSDEDIARLYYNETGIRPCIYGEPEFDSTGDCVVNIDDFAQFAAHWLESGLFVP